MTQIIALITPDYVSLASDRLLTWNGGQRDGEVFRDEECKLIAFCGQGGIGYTGLARLNGMPTHEWVAITLARENCTRLADTYQVLALKTPEALHGVARHLQTITFTIAGWEWFGDPPVLKPHLALVSNLLGDTGNWLTAPTDEFRIFVRPLEPKLPFAWQTVGMGIEKGRAFALTRALRRLSARGLGPRYSLQYLIDEIQHTSNVQRRVGDKILTMCIPRRSFEWSISTGEHFMRASIPTIDVASCGYYDPSRKENLQYGPTMVCAGMATSDFTGTNDEATNTQTASVRLLHLRNRSN
jgi:hypothetical protein